MFSKILVANRGEIAVRVMRTCREMGIRTVAVYSDADRSSLHVRYADEAAHIGAAPSTESYLRMDRILDAARRWGAEAIHPGYGFLAENPQFARACEEAGIIFIGPSAEAMKLMGSKTASRHAAREAGLPVVPGMDTNLQGLEEVRGSAEKIGFPLMLKASAGGGGKGLRLVNSAADLESAWRTARSEAQNAFNDPSVYLEKYIESPRHIEIQILGDHHGNTIYLGERECSLQRRHQKVVEECPSPLVDPAMRRRMGETAVRIARLAKYTNAGTVEFLVDRDHEFYFLEMNTRLQVEHPVTELVTGLDLVREQLRIAAGEPLSLKQEDLQLHGWAMECRIYAEDPANNFFPSPGLITHLRAPAGPGVRVDSGSYPGWRVPLEYDPLLAKLIVYGDSRASAISRLKRALTEYEVGGIKTNIPFFRGVVAHADFLAGRLDTGFIDRFLAGSPPLQAPEDGDSEVAAMVAVALESRRAVTINESPITVSSRWKINGRAAALDRWPLRR
ncbi:MAG: acetyl-CoA carboxylase biotin carboxylase subunit [Deltaproteobacteria bacterium]